MIGLPAAFHGDAQPAGLGRESGKIDLDEDEVVAVVVLRDGVESDEAALKAWAATRLAAYKVPSRIHFRDSLPTTATHRVAKDRLRKEYGHTEAD